MQLWLGLGLTVFLLFGQFLRIAVERRFVEGGVTEFIYSNFMPFNIFVYFGLLMPFSCVCSDLSNL